jgi:uncharacterized membrane protein YkvA (DUF1232 family)
MVECDIVELLNPGKWRGSDVLKKGCAVRSFRNWLAGWKKKAETLKVQIFALYYASRDPRVPWYAKAWVALVVAYAFSPIDLIPDFIPVLGYLDDLILLPLGVVVALKMIPPQVMEDCIARANAHLQAEHPQSWLMAGLILLLWVTVIVWLSFKLVTNLHK